MRIAFATSDGVHVDQEFRRATGLAVYEVGPEGHRHLQTMGFPIEHSARTEERLAAIRGAGIVFGVAFSPSSAVRIAARGIRPATAPAGTPIDALLARLVPAATESAA